MNKIGTVVEFSANVIKLLTLEELFRIEDSLTEQLVHIQKQYECSIETSWVPHTHLPSSKNISVKISFDSILGNYFPCIDHVTQLFEDIQHDTKGYLNFKPYSLTVWNRDRGYITTRYLQESSDDSVSDFRPSLGVLDNDSSKKEARQHENEGQFSIGHSAEKGTTKTMELGACNVNKTDQLREASQNVCITKNESCSPLSATPRLLVTNSTKDSHKNIKKPCCVNVNLSTPSIEMEDAQIYENLMENWVNEFTAEVQIMKKKPKLGQSASLPIISNDQLCISDQDDWLVVDLNEDFKDIKSDNYELERRRSDIEDPTKKRTKITFKIDNETEKQAYEVNDSFKIVTADGESSTLEEIKVNTHYKDECIGKFPPGLQMSKEEVYEEYDFLVEELDALSKDATDVSQIPVFETHSNEKHLQIASNLVTGMAEGLKKDEELRESLDVLPTESIQKSNGFETTDKEPDLYLKTSEHLKKTDVSEEIIKIKDKIPENSDDSLMNVNAKQCTTKELTLKDLRYEESDWINAEWCEAMDKQYFKWSKVGTDEKTSLIATDQMVVVLRGSKSCEQCILVSKSMVRPTVFQRNDNNSTNAVQMSHIKYHTTYKPIIRRFRSSARGDNQRSEYVLFYSFIMQKCENMVKLFQEGDGRIRRVERLCNCKISVSTNDLKYMENFMKINIEYCPKYGNHVGCMDMLSRILNDDGNESRNYRKMMTHTSIFRDNEGRLHKDGGGLSYLKLDKLSDTKSKTKVNKRTTKGVATLQFAELSKMIKASSVESRFDSEKRDSTKEKPKSTKFGDSRHIKDRTYAEYYMADRKRRNQGKSAVTKEHCSNLEVKLVEDLILKNSHEKRRGDNKQPIDLNKGEQAEGKYRKKQHRYLCNKNGEGQRNEGKKTEVHGTSHTTNKEENTLLLSDVGDNANETKTQTLASLSTYNEASLSSSQETIADLTITEPTKSSDTQCDLSFDFDSNTDDDKDADKTKKATRNIENWVAPASYLVCEDDQSKSEASSSPVAETKKHTSILVEQSHSLKSATIPIQPKSVSWAEPLKDFYQPLSSFKEELGPIPPYVRFEYFSAFVPYSETLYLAFNGSARGDARIRRIKNICNCDIKATQVAKRLDCIYSAMLIEIAYDLRYGNHKGCVKMLTELVMEEQKNISSVLIFFPYRAVYSDSSGYRFLKKFAGAVRSKTDKVTRIRCLAGKTESQNR